MAKALMTKVYYKPCILEAFRGVKKLWRAVQGETRDKLEIK